MYEVEPLPREDRVEEQGRRKLEIEPRREEMEYRPLEKGENY